MRTVPLGKYSLALIALTAVVLTGCGASSSAPSAATAPARVVAAPIVAAVATDPVVAAEPVQSPVAPDRAPEHAAPAPVATAKTPAPAQASKASQASQASKPAAPAAAPVTTVDQRTAYINAMYLAVVPAGERAALAGRYVLGYNLAGLSCGTGCTGLFGGQARSSFNNTFFAESLAYQRNTVAHEAAHAYGFLFINNYALASWAEQGGWQAQFNALDRGFVRTYDAEAWAACVAWKESGFNDRVDQITNVCTPAAAALAMAHIA